MAKREWLAQKVRLSRRPHSSQPSASTAQAAAQASASTPEPTASSPVSTTSVVTHRNAALELAIQTYIDKLAEAEKEAFRTAFKNIDEHNLLTKVREQDNQHASSSSFRPRAQRLSRLLRLLDRFMGGVAIGIQANPDLSCIIVGAVRVVIDLAVDFVEFFSKLTDMLCRFEDYLPSLAKFAEDCQESSMVIEALAGAYTDILDFCQHAHAVFIGSDGKRRRWASMRMFLRQQWEPFQAEFGLIGANMQHHVDVLQLAGQAQQLSKSRAAEIKQESKEREDFLNWVSALEFEEAHDNIYGKKHTGTGEWLLQMNEFQTWVNSSKSALLWCYGKRECSIRQAC
jgi:hypothetical protein